MRVNIWDVFTSIFLISITLCLGQLMRFLDFFFGGGDFLDLARFMVHLKCIVKHYKLPPLDPKNSVSQPHFSQPIILLPMSH